MQGRCEVAFSVLRVPCRGLNPMCYRAQNTDGVSLECVLGDRELERTEKDGG